MGRLTACASFTPSVSGLTAQFASFFGETGCSKGLDTHRACSESRITDMSHCICVVWAGTGVDGTYGLQDSTGEKDCGAWSG